MTLVGYWPLNESSGATEAKDHSGKDNHGTINDGGDSTVPGATGIVGQNTYNFDGNNDYVDLGDKFFDGWTEFSVSVWVKPYSIISNSSPSGHNDNEDYIIHKSGNDNDNFGLTSSTGGLAFYVDDGSHNSLVGTSLSENIWQHIVLVYSSSNWKIYEGGRLDKSSDSPGQLISNTINTKIGGRTDLDSGGWFDGNISEVRIYDRALTSSEVQYLRIVSKRGLQTTSKKSS